jgi:hypothetical protein
LWTTRRPRRWRSCGLAVEGSEDDAEEAAEEEDVEKAHEEEEEAAADEEEEVSNSRLPPLCRP